MTERNKSLVDQQGTSLLEKAFRWSFRGLVYNHVWEDPLVDLAALDLQREHRVVMIGSAGCNAIAYLSEDVGRLDAVDINRAHLALFELKTAALKHLPDHDSFFRFFGAADDPKNITYFDEIIARQLSSRARTYWDKPLSPLARRINSFGSGFYRTGLLSRFVGLIHRAAKIRGNDLSQLTLATDLDTQRMLFEAEIAPMFDAKFTHAIARSPISLFALGIPPNQYLRMQESEGSGIINLLRSRIETLACNFPVQSNPFAWQVFARRYGPKDSGAIPYYLEKSQYEGLRGRVNRIQLHDANLIDFLKTVPAGSVNRFNLLDAQDWMTSKKQFELWRQIDRTINREDGRVLFRTAGISDAFYSLPSEMRNNWTVRHDLNSQLSLIERTGLYSGVHVIERKTK